MHGILFGSCDNQYEVHAQLTLHKCQCNILHEDTHDAHVPGLPSTWPGGAGEPCPSLTLPCGHTFNPTAIAVHFLYQHMRCPVCRVGYDGVMRLECVPTDMRDAFRDKLQCMRQSDGPPAGSWFAVRVSDVELDLLLTVEVAHTDNDFTALARTRLYRAAPRMGTSFNTYNTQRSFSRLLSAFLARQTAASDVVLRVCLNHPLFEHPLCSAALAVTDNTSSHTLRMALHNECIARLHYTPLEHRVDVHTSTLVRTCVARLHQVLTYYLHFPV